MFPNCTQNISLKTSFYTLLMSFSNTDYSDPPYTLSLKFSNLILSLPCSGNFNSNHTYFYSHVPTSSWPTFLIVLSPYLHHSELLDCDPNAPVYSHLTAHQPLHLAHFYSCFRKPVQMLPTFLLKASDFHKVLLS